MSILITQIPVATATAQEVLVECTERVCRPYCVNASIQPSASVVFTVGSVKVLNGNAIAPITATVTVVTPSASGCGCAHTQVFTEAFELAFNATTANAVTLAEGGSILVEAANVQCCKAKGVKVTASLTASIA